MGASCVPRASTTFYDDLRHNNYFDNAGREFAARNNVPLLDVAELSDDHRHHPGLGKALPDCLHLCRDGGMLSAWNAELLNLLKAH